jgi:hypothetical protein
MTKRCWFGRHTPPPTATLEQVRSTFEALGKVDAVLYTCQRCHRDVIGRLVVKT